MAIKTPKNCITRLFVGVVLIKLQLQEMFDFWARALSRHRLLSSDCIFVVKDDLLSRLVLHQYPPREHNHERDSCHGTILCSFNVQPAVLKE
jgi:hypothetical protein